MRKSFCALILLLISAGTLPAAGELDCSQFVKLAVRNNPRYQVSAREYLAALAANQSAHSLEDWNLIASGFFQDATPPALTSFSPDYQKTIGYNLGAEKYVAGTGTALKLEQSNTRISANYPPLNIPGMPSSLFAPVSPYYLSSLSLTVVQPILKNAFGLAVRQGLAMSDTALELARLKLSEDWEEFITSLRTEYLTWQKCLFTGNIFRERVKAVEDQLALVKQQRRFGLSEELDLVQLQQKLEAYRIQLQLAQMACEAQEKKVLKLAGLENRSEISAEAFCRTDEFMEEKAAFEYFLSDSNIKKSSDLLVRLQKLNLGIKEDEQNLGVSIIAQARPNAYTHKASDSLEQIGANNEYTVTVNASRPLGNDKARSETKKAGEEYQKSLKQQENILLNSKIALTSLYTNYKYLTRILELNEKNLKLARQRLALERKKFNQGRSSVFFELQAEDDLAQAEITYRETLFSRELIICQIKSLTDRYLIEYADLLKLEG